MSNRRHGKAEVNDPAIEDVDELKPHQRIERLENLTEEMDRNLKAAFPNGDFSGHRAYHEMMIEEGRDRRALIKAVKEKTIAGLVWSLLFVVGLACWQYLVKMVRGG